MYITTLNTSFHTIPWEAIILHLHKIAQALLELLGSCPGQLEAACTVCPEAFNFLVATFPTFVDDPLVGLLFPWLECILRRVGRGLGVGGI